VAQENPSVPNHFRVLSPSTISSPSPLRSRYVAALVGLRQPDRPGGDLRQGVAGETELGPERDPRCRSDGDIETFAA
jgi:hypothetical protein